MSSYDFFIAYIILNKLLFVFFGVWHFVIVRENVGETELSYKLNIWKEYFEFMFVISMALLTLYLFNPILEVRPAINFETRVLLFIFGWIVLLNCKWELFFEQSKWFTLLQYFISGKRNINTAFIVSY
jgi:hypothetical protein